jgi:predicted ester cyclase
MLTKADIERYYYKGWNKSDEAVLREFIAEDVRFRGSLGRRKKAGIHHVFEYMKALNTALSKLTFEVEDVVITEQQVAARVTGRGIHKGSFFGVESSGIEVSWVSAAFLTIADDEIVEIWVLGDIDNLKNQLGAPPDASFEPSSSSSSSSSSR